MSSHRGPLLPEAWQQEQTISNKPASQLRAPEYLPSDDQVEPFPASRREDSPPNKLAHRRISRACVRCRNRKMQCVLAEGDDQGRCQCCIRMEKECSFVPREQTPSSPVSVPISRRIMTASEREQIYQYALDHPLKGNGEIGSKFGFDEDTVKIALLSVRIAKFALSSARPTRPVHEMENEGSNVAPSSESPRMHRSVSYASSCSSAASATSRESRSGRHSHRRRRVPRRVRRASKAGVRMPSRSLSPWSGSRSRSDQDNLAVVYQEEMPGHGDIKDEVPFPCQDPPEPELNSFPQLTHSDIVNPRSDSLLPEFNNASGQRDYILDLAHPERTPSHGAESRRQQKHPATFQCSLCPKRFVRAYNLRSHLRTHTDERPFACTVCDQAFTRQSDRKRHETLHSAGISEASRDCIDPLQDEEFAERQEIEIRAVTNGEKDAVMTESFVEDQESDHPLGDHVPGQQAHRPDRKLGKRFRALARWCRPKPRKNHSRLEWHCCCGQQFWGDFKSDEPEKIDRLVFDLQQHGFAVDTAMTTTASGTSSTTSASTPAPNVSASPSAAAKTSISAALSGIAPTDVRQTSISASSSFLSIGKPVYLELCINRSSSVTRLGEIVIVNENNDQLINTDLELFTSIRNKYNSMRRKGLFALIYQPCDIHYVHFGTQLSAQQTDIYQRPEVLPPATEVKENRYHYHECPLTPLPPMPPQTFYQYFRQHAPDCASRSTLFSDRLPKKLGTSMTLQNSADKLEFGWGIHIIEGPNKPVLAILVAVILFLSFAVSVIYDVATGNTDSGFAIGQWMVAMLSAVLTAIYFQLQGQ